MKATEIHVGKISYQLFQLGCADAINRAYCYTSELKDNSIDTIYRIDLPSRYRIEVYEVPDRYEKPNYNKLLATELILKYENEKIIISCWHWANNEDKAKREERLNLYLRVFSEEIRTSFIGARSKTNLNALKAFPYAFNPVTVTYPTETSQNIRLIPTTFCNSGLHYSEILYAYKSKYHIIYNEKNGTMDVEVQHYNGDVYYETCNYPNATNNATAICNALDGTNIHINKAILISEKNNPTKKIWCYITPEGIIINDNIITSPLRVIQHRNKTGIYFSTNSRVFEIVSSSDGISIYDYKLTNAPVAKHIYLSIAGKAIFNYEQEIEEATDEGAVEKVNLIYNSIINSSKHIRQETSIEYNIDDITNLNDTSQAHNFIRKHISEINKLDYYDGTVFTPIYGNKRWTRTDNLKKYVSDIKTQVINEEKHKIWAKQHPILAIIFDFVNLIWNIISAIIKLFIS